MSTHRHGLVFGKFYPPHQGHHLLIDAAARACDRLTVLVGTARVESIPAAERIAWLTVAHRQQMNITFVAMPCDVPVDLESEAVWTAHVAVMRTALQVHGRDDIDSVFTSEKYGDELARRLGVVHICVDRERVTVPVSGTACRADLAGRWHQLHPATRAGLATRIVVLGSESTGTTTVSRALAEHYRRRGGTWAATGWVPEHGRDYTLEKLDTARKRATQRGEPEPGMDDLIWTADDFGVIARKQTELEEVAAAAGSPVLVCDTDAFATSVWEYRYTGAVRAATSAAGPDLPRRDVYLLTDHVGVPFVQDGIRDGEHVRADMTTWFRDRLTRAGHSWVFLTGPLPDRIALAVRVTDQMLSQRAAFADPLG